MPPDFNFNQQKKKVVDGIAMGVNKHFISLALRTGEKTKAFAVLPEDAVNMLANLKGTIDFYEKQFGKIQPSVNMMPTPFDLTKPDTPHSK